MRYWIWMSSKKKKFTGRMSTCYVLTSALILTINSLFFINNRNHDVCIEYVTCMIAYKETIIFFYDVLNIFKTDSVIWCMLSIISIIRKCSVFTVNYKFVIVSCFNRNINIGILAAAFVAGIKTIVEYVTKENT